VPDYFALIWYSVGATAVICAIISAAVLIFVVPKLIELERSSFAKLLDRYRSAGRWDRIQLWVGRFFWLILGVAGVGALAVSFAAMCAAALHAAINFVARARVAEFASLVQDELSAGTLALRWASVSTFVTWLWMARGQIRRIPRGEQVGGVDSDDSRDSAALRAAWKEKADNERTWFPTDNAARMAMRQVAFYMPPANIFLYHTLHLGLISLAVTFTWVLLAATPDAFELKPLAWLSLFASHDVGLVFGYIYLLKGRVLGSHRVRIYASATGLAILTLLAARQYMLSPGLNVGLVLAGLAVLTALLVVGIAIFEWGSVKAQSAEKKWGWTPTVVLDQVLPRLFRTPTWRLR
jgi:hypothetical protein